MLHSNLFFFIHSFQSLLLFFFFLLFFFVVYSFSPEIWVTTKYHKSFNLMASYEQQGKPLPKFGEWDVNDPASAEGFTVIFNKARDEKKTGGGGSGRITSQRKYDTHKDDDKSSKKKWFCFGP